MFVLGGVYHRFLHPFWPNWNYISPSPRFPWNSRGHFPSKISYLLGPKSVVFSVAREFDQMLPFIFWSHFPWAFPNPHPTNLVGFFVSGRGGPMSISLHSFHHSTIPNGRLLTIWTSLGDWEDGLPGGAGMVRGEIGSHPMFLCHLYRPFFKGNLHANLW